MECCAETGHAWIELFVYRCEHGLGTVVSLHRGPDTSTADRDHDSVEMWFGPLDDPSTIGPAILSWLDEYAL